MKITVFNGSPWAEEGHTHIMAQEFVAGAAQGGAKVQTIQLVTKEIKPCNRCGLCFFKTPGTLIREGFLSIEVKWMAADLETLYL